MEQFDFSVVMAVYNVEDYLREAVESLIRQTIGFSRIQLIMVDDGSTDNSGKICDEYRNKYPENVVVIHKENGRQSSARNAGLPYVRGKYVNFMDSDDTFERNAFNIVWEFMKKHEGILDVCCIPIHYFGDDRGPHLLNDKFDRGSCVVDLLKEPDCVLMNVNSSFYTREAAKKITFDTELYIAEDAKANLQVLMERPVLGLVAGTKYNYRKFGGSTMDKSRKVRIAYLQHLRCFSNWALDKAEDLFGYIPSFVQYTVMYDLLWKIKNKNIPSGVLTQDEAEQYRRYLIETACRIDDDVILQQKYLESSYKTYILEKKYACMPHVKKEKSDIVFTFGSTAATRVSEIKTVWEFLKVDPIKRSCRVEGHFHLFGLNPEDMKLFFTINGRVEPCECFEREEMSQSCLGERVSYARGFVLTVPLKGKTIEIKPVICVDKMMIPLSVYSYRPFFPVSDVYENAYANLEGYVLTVDKGVLKISCKKNWLSRFVRESKFLRELWKRDLLGGRKAAIGRLSYHMLKAVKHRKLWLISDRITKADDNGEALFRFLMENKPKGVNVIYSIQKTSEDYVRMKKVGPCINAMSFRHKMLHLLCDVNISSQADAVTVNPFFGHDDGLRDLLVHQKFVFLQHGITKDDISGWLNRYSKDISGFVTAAVPEFNSIVSGNYYYSPGRVWLTGFPRYDRLYRKDEKKVTVMPTWRKYLMESSDAKTGIWKITGSFIRSDFFMFYDSLLNSERLLTSLEKKGYTLQFFPHPNLQAYTSMFHHDPRVSFLPAQMPYRDIYAESSLVITDYSSAMFDFAYLRKPVLYCQFDSEAFFDGDHVYTKGYFDYERDGFGEVTYDLENAIDKIIEYVENDCQLKKKYKKRIDSFFAFNDKNNCRRVLDRILALQDEL